MRRLPSLSGLEAFIQVARLGSIKAAAAELNLSMPALSRRVQSLEQSLGKPLFSRHHQSLKLTETGRALLTRLGPALDEVQNAIESVLAGEDNLRMRLNVLPLFASQRLFPHLPSLREKHPNLHIDVETLGHGEQRLGEGVDAAITLVREVDPSLYSIKLDQDFVYPIAARKFADGPDKISVPEQLGRMTVLIHSEMPETFDEWRKAIGQPYLEPAGIDEFDSGPLMLEAAAQGVGVAFLLGHHFNDSHDPRLAKLFDFEIESPYAYYFVCRPRALQNPAVKMFRDWLVGERL